MKRLLFPLTYFGIGNRDKVIFVDLLPAAILALAVSIVLQVVGGVNFFSSGGILQNVSVLTATLTGFYVAALTAAATFPNAALDVEIEKGSLILGGRNLTRRQWVSIMFGYLAFSAMAMTLFAAIVVPLASAAPASDAFDWYWDIRTHAWLSPLFKFLLLYWSGHIGVVTCLGLYYLMERLSDAIPIVTSKKPAADVVVRKRKAGAE